MNKCPPMTSIQTAAWITANIKEMREKGVFLGHLQITTEWQDYPRAMLLGLKKKGKQYKAWIIPIPQWSNREIHVWDFLVKHEPMEVVLVDTDKKWQQHEGLIDLILNADGFQKNYAKYIRKKMGVRCQRTALMKRGYLTLL